MRLSPAQLDDLKARNTCDGYAMGLVTLRRKGAGYVGPCPFCSRATDSKTDARFECDADKWLCASCRDGGDIIALVARDKGLNAKTDFHAIVYQLGGSGAVEETPKTALRAGGQAFRRGLAIEVPDLYAPHPALATAWLDGWRSAQRTQQFGERARERERSRLYRNYWQKGVAWRGTPVERYLTDVRRLLVPHNACVRYLADCPLFADGNENEPLLVHRGPAMLAAIWNTEPLADAGTIGSGLGYRFAGLHFTFLDPLLCDGLGNASSSAVRDALQKSKGKAVIHHPHTGELLPVKKSRGSKQGGYIDLGGCRPHLARQMFAAEGIENTLFAFTGLVQARRDLTCVHFRSGIDLGNLAGKAADRIKHPTLTTKDGRAKIVGGVVPDLTSAAMPIPRGILQQFWLCDGDSDPFITRNAMARARARHERAGLTQALLWPGAGLDWNDRVMAS